MKDDGSVDEQCYVLFASAEQWISQPGYPLYAGALLPPEPGTDYWAIGRDPGGQYTNKTFLRNMNEEPWNWREEGTIYLQNPLKYQCAMIFTYFDFTNTLQTEYLGNTYLLTYLYNL